MKIISQVGIIASGLGFYILGNLSPANAAIVNLAGDKDCFGTNKAPCNTVSVNEIVNEGSDGDFDIFRTGSFQWSHNYTPIETKISSAKLTIVTFDLEDGGAGDGAGGAPFDDLLFIDGMEVLGAFNSTFTPDGNSQTQLPINTTTFNLNPAFFSKLVDGSVNIELQSDGGSSSDVIAIDYAELEIKPVPEPLTILGSATALGIGTLLKRENSKKQKKS